MCAIHALCRLEEEIRLTRQEKQAAIEEEERKHIQQAEQSRKEADLKLKNVKQTLIDKTAKEMSQHVKEIMQKNRVLEAELVFQSQETVTLMKRCSLIEAENKDLKGKNSLLTRELHSLLVKIRKSSARS